MNQPDISFTTPEWGKVREWLSEEYKDCLLELSRHGLEERRSDFLRGKAAFISTLLDFNNENAA